MSRKTWPCGHHTSEGIIDGTALNQGQGLKSLGSPWPWPSGARTRWVVVLSSSAFCSAPPRTIALPFSGSPVRVLSRGPGSLGGLLLDAPPWVGLGLKRPSPAPRPSGGIGRRPGPLPGAWQCSCCHPGSSMAFVFLPFNFVLSGVFCRFPPEGAPEQSPRPAQSGLRMHVLCRFTCHSLFDQTGLGANSVPGGWVRTPAAGAPRVLGPPRRPPPPGPRCA